MKVKATLMLILSTILMSDVLAAHNSANRTPHFEFWIFNDLMFIDFFGGVASGFYGRDVLSTWEGCADGLPDIWNALVKEFTSINWSDPFNSIAT